jgi:hypothetical protein
VSTELKKGSIVATPLGQKHAMCRVVIHFLYKTKRVPVPHGVTKHFRFVTTPRYRLVKQSVVVVVVVVEFL